MPYQREPITVPGRIIMKVDVKEKITNFKGEVMRMGDKPDSPEADVKTVIVEALTIPFQDEKIDGMEKMRRFNLAKKVFDASDMVELETEEIVLVKLLVGKAFSPVVVGKVYSILEGK